jgi:hypothetical protein
MREFVDLAFVLFVRSRLEGWFRAEWFRNSTFEDCKLPESLTKESLTTAGNNVTPQIHDNPRMLRFG